MMSDLEMVVYNVLEDMPEIYEKLDNDKRMALVFKVTEYLENNILDGIIREAIEDTYEGDDD